LDGLPALVEVVIVRVDQRTGTVELEIPVKATIGHRASEFAATSDHSETNRSF
jgi:hypothetical protein